MRIIHQHPQDAAARAYESLEQQLNATVQGEVRFDQGSRALYATDASNYRQVPIGVVIPRSVQDVVATVEACRAWNVPVLSRGGGTSLAGQCCNVAVVLDFTKYLDNILEINSEKRYARVQPGVILDDLRSAARKHGLTFGPDPATHNHCTLGGMIGNNSCGIHALMAGKTAENVEELEVLTYDGLRLTLGKTSPEELERKIAQGGRVGQIYRDLKALGERYDNLIRKRYPKIPRRVSGYNLDELLPEKGFNLARAVVGSEGTCITILSAKVRLVDEPSKTCLAILGFSDICEGVRHVPRILKYDPIGLEGIDDRLFGLSRAKSSSLTGIKKFPDGNGWLLVEFGGDSEREACEKAQQLIVHLKNKRLLTDAYLAREAAEQKEFWEIRESALGTTAFPPNEHAAWPGWEDAAVPPDKEADYLADFRQLLKRYDYTGATYGHFGQGCIHVRISFDLDTEAGVRKYRAFVEEAADLVVRYGGSLSGEHGDGQARGEQLDKMYGQELVQAFREFKRIWDPQGKMNPGKVVDPLPLDRNLRLGPEAHIAEPETQFHYPEDGGSFAHASIRCVGVGRCRRKSGGTMCPSYMATREERHSTRGRAHLLHEMLRGDTIKDGWRSEAVKEALDLCLACKGCKHDCPVNVDLATYKSEFMAKHYDGRLRHRSAYAMGLIDQWARLASIAPAVANLVSQQEPFASLAKELGGLAPDRKLPKFAAQTFKQWFSKQQDGKQDRHRPKVILWADTFNNHFHPHHAKAAYSVLEAAGFQIEVPQQHLCCGRPLYDFGMLERAKAYLRKILNVLVDEIASRTPIIVLEPSCLSVFRDELCNLLPKEPRARDLANQVFSLSEFMEKKVPTEKLPRFESSVVLHGHCHQKALWGLESDVRLLKKMGAEVHTPDTGCCGMAGSFGFEKEKVKVSRECARQGILSAVQSTRPDAFIIADGFSCQEQIKQESSRQAIHLAQALSAAWDGVQFTKSHRGPAEKPLVEQEEPAALKPIHIGLAAASLAAAAWGLHRLNNYRQSQVSKTLSTPQVSAHISHG